MHWMFIWFSSLSFFGFGGACLFSASMRKEFTRYGLSGQRSMVGILQLGGAAGLLLGFAVPPIGTIAAAGLALLMLLGVGVRIMIQDTFLQTLPALFYMLLNASLCMFAF